MINTQKIETTLNPNETYRSDGSELIPAEAQDNAPNDNNQMRNDPLTSGYTVDEEGIVNNYAVEPETFSAVYPSPEQQKRYLRLGVGAIVFVTVILLIAFAVS